MIASGVFQVDHADGRPYGGADAPIQHQPGMPEGDICTWAKACITALRSHQVIAKSACYNEA